MSANYDKSILEAKGLLGSNPNYSIRPINLATILKDLGLGVEYGEIDDEALLDPMEKKIYIRKDDLPITRKFFSIAHEIGHWMLHSRDKRRPRLNYDSISNEIELSEEQEANAFAAELLMPYDEVRKMIILGYSIEDLANHFNTSYDFSSNRYNFIIKRIF